MMPDTADETTNPETAARDLALSGETVGTWVTIEYCQAIVDFIHELRRRPPASSALCPFALAVALNEQ